jgi:hypothetical protein
MSTQLIDTLDTALEQLRAGQSLPAILADYPAQAEVLTPLLKAATVLDVMRPVEMPDLETLRADRYEFLAELNRLQAQPVSPGPLMRLKEWMAHRLPWPSSGPNLLQKEQRRMSVLLVKATLIIGLVFGSASGAVALAANSLPDSPLYPAKLAMEQTRLAVTAGPAEQADLHMSLAGVRVQEMERLALAGKVPDQPTALRLEMHLNQAFHMAAQLPDENMLGFLTQAGQTIQTQEQALRQVQSHAAEPAQEPLQQASRFLSQARQEVQLGLQDPQTFRWRHIQNRPPDAPPQPSLPPAAGDRPGCPEGDCEPAGDQNQYGPQPDRPGPGGPGGNPDCPDGDCEPVGDQNQYGPQPDQPGPGMPGGNPDCPSGNCGSGSDQDQYQPPADNPGPGEPGGNPDCEEQDCEPAGDQNQHGPQPDQPGPGGPGGNPDCSSGDCEPSGDENHHGTPPSEDNGQGDSCDKGDNGDAGQNGDDNGGGTNDNGGSTSDNGGTNDNGSSADGGAGDHDGGGGKKN